MEVKLIALTLFVLILIYFNYRRYKRLERQRVLLQNARNGLVIGTGNPRSRRAINISTSPRHQIAIIFPPSPAQNEYNNNINNPTSISIHNSTYNDLPPSYQDLFSEQSVLPNSIHNSNRATPAAPTQSRTAVAAAEPDPGGRNPNNNNVLPSYRQIMSNCNNVAQQEQQPQQQQRY